MSDRRGGDPVSGRHELRGRYAPSVGQDVVRTGLDVLAVAVWSCTVVYAASRLADLCPDTTMPSQYTAPANMAHMSMRVIEVKVR